jgi:hypothetical protein
VPGCGKQGIKGGVMQQTAKSRGRFIRFLTIGSCVGVLVTLKCGLPLKKKAPWPLRVAIPEARQIENYDPVTFKYADEKTVVEALYSSLVKFDYDTDQVVADEASHFYWKENQLHFGFERRHYTKNRIKIGARDAYFSLMRLMVLSNKPLIRYLRNVLCHKSSLASIHEPCSGLKHDDNELIISFPARNPNFLALLSCANFSVIPYEALHEKSLKIINYEDTTGPYYYAGKNDKGYISLRPNAEHWIKHENAAGMTLVTDEIITPRSGHKEAYSIEQFIDGSIDHIPTHNLLGKDDIEKIEASMKDAYDTHLTAELSIVYMAFTDAGMKLSLDDRRRIALVIQSKFGMGSNELGKYRRATRQFFFPQGFGGLSAEQSEKLSAGWLRVEKTLPDYDIVIAVPNWLIPWYASRLGALGNIQLVATKYATSQPAAQGSKVPVLTVMARDMNFGEDIQLLSEILTDNVMPLRGQAAYDWLQNYIETVDFDKKLSMVREIHQEALFDNTSLIPLFSRPGIAFSRNHWQMHLKKNTLANPLWKIVNSR